MTNKTLTYLSTLLLPALLCLPACRKDDPTPTKQDPCPWPEVTTEGKHTFGCKINGKEWVPCVDIYGTVATLRPIDCLVTESDGSNFLSISVTRFIKDSTYSATTSNGQMFLGYKPCKEGFLIIPENFFHASTKLFADWEGYSYEAIDTTAENYLDVTRLDTAANIIAGQFQITLIDIQTGKKAKITDGRFDLKYYPQ